MHAIACLNIAVCQPLGNALVGKQHSFLDERRGTRALAGHDLHGNAVLVQQSANLRRVKVDRAARTANATASLGKLVGSD